MRAFVAFLLVAAVVAIPAVSLAKQWSPAEEEVWQVVDEWHDVILKEGFPGAERFLHKDLTFWGDGLGAPLTRDAFDKWFRFWDPREDWDHYQLARIEMHVVDNVAVCQYYLTVVLTTTKQETEVYKAQAQVTLIKKEGKWVVLSIFANPYEMK